MCVLRSLHDPVSRYPACKYVCMCLSTVEPCYNIGLYDISSIASAILWYQLIRRY
jgi:hypothetical protein